MGFICRLEGEELLITRLLIPELGSFFGHVDGVKLCSITDDFRNVRNVI